MRKNIFQKIQVAVIRLLAKISWDENDGIPEDTRAELRDMLAKDYYIVATRRDNYLSSWFMNFGHYLLTGRWGFYTHVLMNTEDSVSSNSDFRFIEATGSGTHYSTLDDILHGVEAVALLKPKSMTTQEWTECLDRARTFLGRPYDNLFDLVNSEEINCVELVRNALMALPDYHTRFAHFEYIIQREDGKLTPTMFYECSDFEVVYEKRY